MEKTPSDVTVRVLLGRAQLAQGKLRPAFDTLVEARTADPSNIDALYYLSFAARALSGQEYQRLFATAPDSARVHQLLGEAALQVQDPGRSILPRQAHSVQPQKRIQRAAVASLVAGDSHQHAEDPGGSAHFHLGSVHSLLLH